MDKKEAIEGLREYDHAFLSEEGADTFSDAFGFKARTAVVEATPNEPKGLTLKNGAKSARGIAADELAVQICEHVGVEYPEMFGRGSRLRACCDALEQFLSSKK
jgi:hypothetical protein